MKVVSSIIIMLIVSVFTNYTILNTANADNSSTTVSENYILTSDSSKTEVIKLQKIFSNLGLYNGKFNGDYLSIKEKIISLQLDFGLIKTKSDLDSGNITKTFLIKLKQNFSANFDNNKKEEKQTSEEKTDKIEETKFIVTAYYSPIPNQKKYATGTYAGDIRLNGNGTHGASGKRVHPGFFAAPKNYSFGTKIELEGLGVGVVEDRGGAIVKAGVRGYEYDRIDVWMGFGDEGLKRALNWGKKTVKGEVLKNSAEITIEFESSPLSEYYNIKVTPESEGEQVTKLQELLAKVDAYNGKIDGKYKSVENDLIIYQKKVGLIENSDSWGGGYFGDKTFTALEKDFYANYHNQSDTESTTTIDNFASLTRSEKKKLTAIKEKIANALEKKAKGNKIIINTYNNKIKKKLDTIIKKTSNYKQKEKLKFLRSII